MRPWEAAGAQAPEEDVETTQRRPLLDAHHRLEEAVEQCFRAVDVLEERLDPVLVHYPTVAAKSDGLDSQTGKIPQTSQVVGLTLDCAERVETLYLKIQQMTGRVDL